MASFMFFALSSSIRCALSLLHARAAEVAGDVREC
jgi:hypothetical protein